MGVGNCQNPSKKGQDYDNVNVGNTGKTSTKVKILTFFMVVIIITGYNAKGYAQETRSSLKNTNCREKWKSPR